jgi:hypothetical protein
MDLKCRILLKATGIFGMELLIPKARKDRWGEGIGGNTNDISMRFGEAFSVAISITIVRAQETDF